MKLQILSGRVAMMAMAAMSLFAACKKEKANKDTTPGAPIFTTLPEATLFVSRLDTTGQSDPGRTIYMIDASTGALATKYRYPVRPHTIWSFPAVGNGFLYSLQNNSIDAIDPNTGAVLWTDTVSNINVPFLRDNVFYGSYPISTVFSLTPPYLTVTYGIYALDATKPSKTYLWKYETTDNYGVTPIFSPTYDRQTVSSPIRYHDGALYVLSSGLQLTVLDARTGALRWKLTTDGSEAYSLAALDQGLILAGDTVLDAATGSKIATVKPANVPPTYGPATVQRLMVEYATQDLFFVKTYHFNTPPGQSTTYLSAVDRSSGIEKWLINAGSGQSSYDTSNTVSTFWNNRLVVKKDVNTGAGKYGVNTAENFRLLDTGNGAVSLTFDDLHKGNTSEQLVAGNTMYFNKIGVTLGPFYMPNVNYLFAIDLATGQRKWTSDQLLADYSGASYSCVLLAGKGYSPYIQ